MKNIYLECGKVMGPHGVRGVLKVESWCDTPKVLASQKRVFIAARNGEYEERKVLGASVSGPSVLLTLEGIDDRDVAVAMKNTVLYLHRDDIPVKRGQMLLADMIGLAVIDADTGVRYGEIKEVTEVPRGLLYTVATDSGDVYYPSGKEFIKKIDPDEGMLITPIPGFFED
jgi:16S rRNA processing protein RimM